jgi:serine/threonine-protein kinase HipA
MRKLEVRLDWGDEQVVVGTLAEHEKVLYFEYDSAFIAKPLPISPFKLPIQSSLFEHREREFGDVFGVFNDSLPDGWGLLLMDREFRKRGHDPAGISILDRLAYIGTRGMGALTYHPPAAPDDEGELLINLDELAHQAERVLAGSAEEILPALRIAGGSPGGARPKVLIGIGVDGRLISGASDLPEGYRHFIVKFPSREDVPDIGAVEAAYALMAREAGIEVPTTRLFETKDGGRYFGAERFDRLGTLRLHMHTLSGLFHASHRIPSMGYEGLLKATMALTRDRRQMEEAFRRMAFNVFAHNRDDHVKNFSYLMDRSGEWRFAPAYDIMYSQGPGGEHTMAVAGEAARPTERDMLRVAEDCDVDSRRAREIIRQVRDAVNQWPRFALAMKVSDETASWIEKVIVGP